MVGRIALYANEHKGGKCEELQLIALNGRCLWYKHIGGFCFYQVAGGVPRRFLFPVAFYIIYPIYYIAYKIYYML